MAKKGTWRGLAALGIAFLGPLAMAGFSSAQSSFGTLVIQPPPSSPSPSPSPTPSPGITLDTIDVSGAKGPYCGPKFIGAAAIQALEQYGITGPDALGVEMTVIGKPLLLHNLRLQLYSEGQVIWQSDAECVGCVQVYPVSEQGTAYTFRLDPTGVALATQLYPQATAVGLAGMAHDGYLATFRFVRTDPAVGGK